MEYQIEFNDVTMEFPNDSGGTNRVLTRFNLRVPKGQVVVVVGGSGSGKSTAFNLGLGTLKPTSGAVLFNGQPILGEGPERGIVPQNYSLFPFKRVVDNIAFGPVLSATSMWQRLLHTPHFRRTQREARRAAIELLPQLGLDPGAPELEWPLTSRVPLLPQWRARRAHESNTGDRERLAPHTLSGGMQQRVAIGTALATHPVVMMMDEPFGAVDPETRETLHKLTLRKWKELGLTIILVTHHMEEAVYLADRVVGLSKYWLDKDGKPGNGATIVLDKEITEPRGPDGLRSAEFMDTAQFHDVCTHIQRLAMDSTRRVAWDQFELTHPDAVHPAAA